MKKILPVLAGIISLMMITACPTPNDPVLSADKEFITFSFNDSDNTTLSGGVTGTISETDIALTITDGTEVTDLVAAFEFTGASVSVGGTEQISGSTANDFSNPVIYRLTAEDGTTQDYTVTVTRVALTAGYKESFVADGVSFEMAYVPGGFTFPTGVDDTGTATVAKAYWIADTEVTYELWDTVYNWATAGAGGAAGEGLYIFAHTGTQGDGSGDTNQHPVTEINWRDSMVWCNALTEWYNAHEAKSYECVYTYSGAIIRDAGDSNTTACDSAVAGSTAYGFRLLTSAEWELAARYRDGTNWTYGDHVSGDDSGACFDDTSILGGLGMSSVYSDYSWHINNSGGSTHVVGTAGNSDGAARSGNGNALGLYDMSGNVWEWCYTVDSLSWNRDIRGGYWDYYPQFLRIGMALYAEPVTAMNSIGFRLCRTAD